MLTYLFVLGFIANLSSACLDCPEDVVRGKLSLGGTVDDDFPKTIALSSRSVEGKQQQQKICFYPKALAQQRVPPNMLHVYSLLKGSADPRLLVDDYFQDSVVSRPSKKAEKGMLVDVMDFVTKNEDRNRRVGQNMRSSG